MIKILTVIGTRPEAIKLAPVLRQLEHEPELFRSVVVVTGQHRELLDPMLSLFEIEADYDLRVMLPEQSLSDVTLRVIAGLEPVFAAEDPDWVLVQGDTTSVMAASVASFYRKVRLGHVEAGLRTFDKYSPFPEEINRRITGVLADVHFAPTSWARSNLLREGVPAERVRLTGNTIVDALHHVSRLELPNEGTQPQRIPADRRLVVVTTHRQENFGFRMQGIATALRELALSHGDIHIAYLLHLNPKARLHAERNLAGLPNVSLLEPVGYQEMVALLNRAHLVVTDSGGLQEEAAAVQTPVLVLRDTTERPEGVQSGIAELVRPNHLAIVQAAERILTDGAHHRRMATSPCPYGDGTAARRIVDALADRPDTLDSFDSVYERPKPQHPLDALLREATAGIPRHYADQVRARLLEASDSVVGGAGG